PLPDGRGSVAHRGTLPDGRATSCGSVTRRFAFQAAAGFLGSALGALWADDGKVPASFPARAKSVIFLFMCGGVSHIDTFDPKDNKWAGKMMDAVGFGDNLAEMRRP